MLRADTHTHTHTHTHTQGQCDKNQKPYWQQLSDGLLEFKPANPSHPEKTVDELALLLTGGRLSSQTRDTLVEAYGSFLSEVKLDVKALQESEMKKQARNFANCETITDKAECCK